MFKYIRWSKISDDASTSVSYGNKALCFNCMKTNCLYVFPPPHTHTHLDFVLAL